MNIRDIMIRAGKTFVQAAVPIWMSIDITGVADEITRFDQTLYTGGVAGAAAILSMVWNALLQWSADEYEEEDE